MKIQNTLFTLATTVLLACTSGCDKQDASVQDQIKNAAGNAGDAVKSTADVVKESGEKAAAAVKDKAKEVAAPVSAKVQELIDSAKSLVGEGKYQDALVKLKELGGEKLPLSQQAIVDGLKAQIQKALGAATPTATDAVGAAGNLLKK
jgi:hypothetical protein